MNSFRLIFLSSPGREEAHEDVKKVCIRSSTSFRLPVPVRRFLFNHFPVYKSSPSSAYSPRTLREKAMCTLVNAFALLISVLLLLHRTAADVGTAVSYRPPYHHTACFGDDSSQFPSGNLFAAAGEGIWDNGAACGRFYRVRCLSSAVARACAAGRPSVVVKIVDRAARLGPLRGRPTMALSLAAFGAITNSSVGGITQINVDFLEIS
ncbi:EG45-like domain containing protein [Wolffia australiana]